MRSPIRVQPMLIALSLLNLVGLAVVILREPAKAAPAPSADVLRGRALEIVDDHGRVRASIALSPAARQANGSSYPETVLLRLITSEGRPVVKISSSEDGAGMALSAAQGRAYVQVLARGDAPNVVIVNGAGKETSKLP